MMAAIFYGAAAVALLGSWLLDRARTRAALGIAARSLVGLVPRILGLVALVGLALALVPPELLRRVFAVRGVAGFALVSAIGAVVTMPGPIAFPLVGSLARLGADPAALAAFVTTLTMVGVVTAPMEIAAFGRRFTLLRQGFSFVTALAIGLLMGVFL